MIRYFALRRAQLLAEIGRRDAEIEALVIAIDAAPRDAEAHRQLARAWAARGNSELAHTEAAIAVGLEDCSEGGDRDFPEVLEQLLAHPMTAVHPTEGGRDSRLLDRYERVPVLVRGALWALVYIAGLLVWHPWAAILTVILQGGLARLRARRMDRVGRLYIQLRGYSDQRAFELSFLATAVAVPILLFALTLLAGLVPGAPPGLGLAALVLAPLALVVTLVVGARASRRRSQKRSA